MTNVYPNVAYPQKTKVGGKKKKVKKLNNSSSFSRALGQIQSRTNENLRATKTLQIN